MPKLAKTSADDDSDAPSNGSPSNGSSISRSVTDGKGPAQIHYEKHSRALKVLVAMCRGLCDDRGVAIFVETEQPWKGMKVAAYRPTALEHKNEILRRALLKADNVSPRPGQWSLTKVLQWLDEHPITNLIDREFLMKTFEEVKGNAILNQAERQEEMDTAEKKWTGKVPYLRLIHALVDNDEVKSAFLKRHDIPKGRMAIESRNSEDREPSVWELLTMLWNDPSFEPITEELGNLHSDFSTSEVLSYNKISDLVCASPEKCKGKINSMMLQLNQVIMNWERSGQGDGGVDVLGASNDEENDAATKTEFGCFANRTDRALDLRKSFVSYNQSYLLYFWHMLDKHDLMKTLMQQLDYSVSAKNGATAVQKVINLRSDDESFHTPKKMKVNTVDSEMQQLSQSIRQHGVSMERSELRGTIEALKKERRELMLQLAKTSLPSVREVLIEQVKALNSQHNSYEICYIFFFARS